MSHRLEEHDTLVVVAAVRPCLYYPLSFSPPMPPPALGPALFVRPPRSRRLCRAPVAPRLSLCCNGSSVFCDALAPWSERASVDRTAKDGLVARADPGLAEGAQRARTRLVLVLVPLRRHGQRAKHEAGPTLSPERAPARPPPSLSPRCRASPSAPTRSPSRPRHTAPAASGSSSLHSTPPAAPPTAPLEPVRPRHLSARPLWGRAGAARRSSFSASRRWIATG